MNRFCSIFSTSVIFKLDVLCNIRIHNNYSLLVFHILFTFQVEQYVNMYLGLYPHETSSTSGGVCGIHTTYIYCIIIITSEHLQKFCELHQTNIYSSLFIHYFIFAVA